VPVKWYERTDKRWNGLFVIGDMKYEVLFSFYGEMDGWEIEFNVEWGTSIDKKLDSTQGMTGTGNQFQVLATVSKVFDEFLKKIRPEKFYFTAANRSRKVLYSRFAKMITQKYPYKNTFNKDGLFNFERK